MSPRTGRPRLDDPNTNRMSVCMNAETMKRLEEYCAKYGVSKGEAIRRGIMKLLEEEKE